MKAFMGRLMWWWSSGLIFGVRRGGEYEEREEREESSPWAVCRPAIPRQSGPIMVRDSVSPL